MVRYVDLKKRAKKVGLNLWETGGYYRLSGYIRGKHRQGTFSNLRQVENQIRVEERYQKNKR